VNAPQTETVQRLLLAFAVPFSGFLLALPLGALLLVGVPESTVNACGVPVMVVAAGVAGWAAPRVLRYAARYSGMRRVLAGVLSVAATNLVGRGLERVGVDGDALSNVQGPFVWDGIRAMLHEGSAMACVYGTLVGTAFLVLGRPRSEELRAAEQAAPQAEVRREDSH
jgi:hypothetical protein